MNFFFSREILLNIWLRRREIYAAARVIYARLYFALGYPEKVEGDVLRCVILSRCITRCFMHC